MSAPMTRTGNPNVENDRQVAELFRAGCDTAEIARALGSTEAAVYNALARRPAKRGEAA